MFRVRVCQAPIQYVTHGGWSKSQILSDRDSDLNRAQAGCKSATWTRIIQLEVECLQVSVTFRLPRGCLRATLTRNTVARLSTNLQASPVSVYLPDAHFKAQAA